MDNTAPFCYPRAMVKYKDDTRQLINQAWLRDGVGTVSGEALLLACVLHSTGAGRNSMDHKAVREIFEDHNL